MPHRRLLSTGMSLWMVSATVFAPTARAAGPERRDGSVLVWPADATTDVADVEAALTEEGHEVVPFAPVADALQTERDEVRQATLTRLAQIEGSLQRAQELYLAQDWDGMITELGQLQSDALDVLARPEGCGTLWEIEFRLGLGHGARKAEGDAAQRTEHFAMALALDGARRPLGELYGPDVVAAFLSAVDDATTRLPRATPIAVTPPDATVTIDCSQVAHGDQVQLVPGRHAVLVEAPGYVSHTEIVNVASGEPIEVTLQPDATEDPVRRLATTWPRTTLLPTGPASRQAIGEVAKGSGAARWIVLAPGESGTRAELWQDGRRRRIATEPHPPQAALAVLAVPKVDLGGGEVIRDPEPGGGGSDTGNDDKRLVRRWWFWTIIGGSVVATGLGLGLGLGLRQPESDRLQVVVR